VLDYLQILFAEKREIKRKKSYNMSQEDEFGGFEVCIFLYMNAWK
jgi:hypothetical protein